MKVPCSLRNDYLKPIFFTSPHKNLNNCRRGFNEIISMIAKQKTYDFKVQEHLSMANILQTNDPDLQNIIH